jgi:hypothetical protein
MGPLEFLGPIGAYPAVPHVSGTLETLVGIGLAIVAIAIVTGITLKYRTPS